jgi:hypothetical protein
MAKHVSEYFTVPGRVLILSTILLATGGTVGYMAWAVDDGLREGTYPIWLFALPVLLAAGLFFALGVGVLRYFGVAVFKDPDTPSDASAEQTATADRPRD